MSRAERLTAEGILREYLEGLPHRALTRVVTAENWRSGSFNRDGARCLCGHAEDWNTSIRAEDEEVTDWALTTFGGRVEAAFDELCAARGIAYVRALVQSKAAVLLHDREEAVVAALLQPAFCPLAAREESLT